MCMYAHKINIIVFYWEQSSNKNRHCKNVKLPSTLKKISVKANFQYKHKEIKIYSKVFILSLNWWKLQIGIVRRIPKSLGIAIIAWKGNRIRE